MPQATLWQLNGSWLDTPPASVEGLLANGSAALALIRLAAPKYDPTTSRATFTVSPIPSDGAGVLPGGAVAFAVENGVKQASPAADGTTTLTSVALFVDAAVPADRAAAGGAKQGAYTGCAGAALGGLSSFGSYVSGGGGRGGVWGCHSGAWPPRCASLASRLATPPDDPHSPSTPPFSLLSVATRTWATTVPPPMLVPWGRSAGDGSRRRDHT